MNLNRQGKLYSQGHSPLVKTVPGKPKWERTRDKPSYEVCIFLSTLSSEARASRNHFFFSFLNTRALAKACASRDHFVFVSGLS